MFRKFKLQGNVPGAIRSDEDMKKIDKDLLVHILAGGTNT